MGRVHGHHPQLQNNCLARRGIGAGTVDLRQQRGEVLGGVFDDFVGVAAQDPGADRFERGVGHHANRLPFTRDELNAI